MTSDDAALLARWRGGDESAGNALVRRHFDLLYRFFSGRFDEGVPDLVQRTFLGAVQARDRLPDDVNFKAYLLGIAHRLLLMAYRSRRRRDRIFTAGDASGTALVTSPSRAVARRERQRALLASIRELSLEHQIVVQLFYWEDLSIDEVAEVVQVPPGTVKSRLHRARQLLRQTFSGHVAAPDPDVSIEDFDAWAKRLWEPGPQPEETPRRKAPKEKPEESPGRKK